MQVAGHGCLGIDAAPPHVDAFGREVVQRVLLGCSDACATRERVSVLYVGVDIVHVSVHRFKRDQRILRVVGTGEVGNHVFVGGDALLVIAQVVVELPQLYPSLASQRALWKVVHQLLQDRDGLLFSVKHREGAALLVQGVVEVGRIGVTLHEVVQRVDFPLVVAL